MMLRAALAMAVALCAAPVPTFAQELPPVSDRMVGKAAIVCARIGVDGTVSGAFIIKSSGDPAVDGDIVAWVKQLHWPAAEADDARSTDWFPMPVGFGGAVPPRPPASCAPTDKAMAPSSN